MTETPSITCPKCGKTSWNPNDIEQKYCGNCHLFHDDITQKQNLQSHRTGLVKCPNCDETYDFSLSLPGDQREPQPGDASVCAACAFVSEYFEDGYILSLRPLDQTTLPMDLKAQILFAKRTWEKVVSNLPQAHSIHEAQNWFLANSKGAMVCHSSRGQKRCRSFPEAKAWFGVRQ